MVMDIKRLKMILLSGLIILSINVHSKNINYGISNNLNIISCYPGSFIFRNRLIYYGPIDMRGQIQYMIGPTIKFSVPNLEKLTFDASIMISPSLDFGVPVYLNYTLNRPLITSLGLGIYEYIGKYNHIFVYENYYSPYLGLKAQKEWNIKKIKFDTALLFNLNTTRRNVADYHPGRSYFWESRYYILALNLFIHLN